MKFLVEYRGELEAVVEAVDEEEAVEKFLSGKVETVTVNYSELWPDQVVVTRIKD